MSNTTQRGVDQDHPRYQEGERAANRALDRTATSAADILAAWELACERFHQEENVDMYHYGRGIIAVLREFLEDRAQ